MLPVFNNNQNQSNNNKKQSHEKFTDKIWRNKIKNAMNALKIALFFQYL